MGRRYTLAADSGTLLAFDALVIAMLRPLVLLLPLVLVAVESTPEARLVPVAGEGDLGAFASSLALADGLLVCGAPGTQVLFDPDPDGGSGPASGDNAGEVFLYRLDTEASATGAWVREATLRAVDGLAHDHFGRAVAASGDTVAVGAPGPLGASLDPARHRRPGKVYVFERNGDVWTDNAILSPVAGHEGDRVGAALALDGNTLVIGASGHDREGTDAGVVHVYERTAVGAAWIEVATLQPPGLRPLDEFGAAVAVSAGTIAVGARLDDEYGENAGAAYVFSREADGSWNQQAKLIHRLPQAGDWFGVAVALQGDTLVVGAHGRDGTTPDLRPAHEIGAAYVFSRTGDLWEQQAELRSGDFFDAQGFATALTLDGDRLAIGAYLDDHRGSNAGAVWLFRRRGGLWERLPRLGAGDADKEDRFGFAVALAGDHLVAGALGEDEGGFEAGAAYPFALGTGTVFANGKLASPVIVPRREDRFGAAVALGSDLLAIGAPADDSGGTDAGAVYIFARSDGTWQQEAKLLPRDLAAGDAFGSAVDLDGEVLVVGAPGDDHLGTDRGSAYVFRRFGPGEWQEQQKLVASDGLAGDALGSDVAVDGSWLVLGAPGSDSRGDGAGAAYIWRAAGYLWGEDTRITAADGAEGHAFGAAVALAEEVVLVGAWGADGTTVLAAGSAYVFIQTQDADEAEPSWKLETKLAPANGEAFSAFGWSVALSANGVALVGAPDEDRDVFDGGAAYAFSRDADGNWVADPRIASPAPTPSARFGASLAMAGPYGLIGEPGGTGAAPGAGLAHLLARDPQGWRTVTAFAPDVGLIGDDFASAVDLDGERYLVGAPLFDDLEADDGTAWTFFLDVAPPSVAITSQTTIATNQDPIPITITFSEAVTGFDLADLVIDNGTAANFAGEGAVYTAEVAPAAEGLVTVDLAVEAAIDAAGNPSLAAATFSRTWDITPPTFSLSSDTTVVTGNVLITVAITASEDLEDFSDRQLRPIGCLVFRVEEVEARRRWNAEIFPTRFEDVGLDIDFGVIADAAGNRNQAASFRVGEAAIRRTMGLGLHDAAGLPVAAEVLVDGVSVGGNRASDGGAWVPGLSGHQRHVLTLVPLPTGDG